MRVIWDWLLCELPSGATRLQAIILSIALMLAVYNLINLTACLFKHNRGKEYE